MKNFESEIYRIFDLFKKGSPFSFSKYADGEWAIINDINLNNKEFEKTPLTPSFFKNKLIESFRYKDPNYYIGVSCPCCQGGEAQKMIDFSGQDYEHYLKAIQLELETSSEEEIEDNPIEPNGVRCSNCNNYHDELSSESDEEVSEDEKPLTFKEYRGEYLYSIIVDKKVLGYIDDHKQLLEYLTIIKKRIHNSYQYDGTFKYWMKYFWNETVMFDWNNDLVVKYSLVSMNTHNLLSYDRLETTLTVYRMKNLLIK